ncbi:hypothetical protein E4U41_000345 [Claviceps citrina]|nr:hypothetical protein E4U41_000345 [Claviceps citrina]
MPLFEMSPNVQEIDSAIRKRRHDEYAGDVVTVTEDADAMTLKTTPIRPAGDSCELASLLLIGSLPNIEASPSEVGSAALAETGGSMPARNSASPLTPPKAKPGKPLDGDNTSSTMSPSGMAPSVSSAMNQRPTPKRKRRTAVEKEAKEKELAEKKKEREEQAAKRAAEKASQEEEKAARVKEREDKRRQKEEEDRLKADQRDERRRKKEEEQRRIQEEKERKARSQPKLNAFFKIPSSTKSESHSVSDVAGPMKEVKSAETEYDKLFKPFFLRENTRLAPCTTQMDQETKEAKSRILDEYIARRQDDQEPKRPSFDAMEHLCLPFKPWRRGKIHHPVKHIMESASSGTGGTFDEARKKLASIPQKVIAFSQDVRPPYYGTITLKPFALGRDTMSRLARRPMGRCLPLDYDYDSEAEWQEEEGEDVDMDEDEDEELDEEDNLDGFLDDTEDAGLSRRVFGHAMEPESTGICFENQDRLGPNRTAYDYKMEFMHGKTCPSPLKSRRDGTDMAGWMTEGLGHDEAIDPFSTQYWESETKAKPAKACKSAAAASSSTRSSAIKMPPPPAPVSAFAALQGDAGNAAAAATKLVKAELMNEVKQAILDNKALSKVGIIDFIFHQFRDNVSRAEVKNTLELVAEKKGAGRSKEWDLKPGHEISL